MFFRLHYPASDSNSNYDSCLSVSNTQKLKKKNIHWGWMRTQEKHAVPFFMYQTENNRIIYENVNQKKCNETLIPSAVQHTPISRIYLVSVQWNVHVLWWKCVKTGHHRSGLLHCKGNFCFPSQLQSLAACQSQSLLMCNQSDRAVGGISSETTDSDGSWLVLVDAACEPSKNQFVFPQGHSRVMSYITSC